MFGRGKRPDTPEGPTGPESVFVGLRSTIVDLDPASIGLHAGSPHAHVWGALMDMGYPNRTWATLVVLGDGTTSLYTSTGGGTIGAGSRAEVRTVGEAWLATIERNLAILTHAGTSALPPDGFVTIRALTFDGQRAVEAAADDLGHGRHPASPLFHSAHAVITQIRLLS